MGQVLHKHAGNGVHVRVVKSFYPKSKARARLCKDGKKFYCGSRIEAGASNLWIRLYESGRLESCMKVFA